jgi:predicted MFS family arabinose efflux permease
VKADESRPGSVASVLRILVGNRELQRVELAYLTFTVAEWGTWLAMLVYAYDRGGTTEAGVLATLLLVPAAILAPVLGGLAERFPPGRSLVAGYTAQAVSCGLVAVAMLLNADRLVVYALLVLPSIAYTMTRPGQASFAPGLARRPEQLAVANVVSGWIESVSTLAGPLLVGVVLSFSAPDAVFAVGAVLGLGAALLVGPMRDLVAPAHTQGTESGTSVAASIGFVGRDANARNLLLVLGAQSVAIGALDILYVELARGVYDLGGNWAGYLNAAFGVGSVLAVVITARLVGYPRLAVPLVVSLAGWSVALFALGALPSLGVGLVLLAVAGGSRATFDVTGRTLLQRVARPDLLARVFGLLEGTEMAGLALGSLLAPALISLGGARAAFIGVGLVLPLAALVAGRRLLDIDRHATVPVVEIALLRSLPMFAPLPPPTLESLARGLELEVVPAGVDVIVQGDAGDRLYVVAEGEVDIVADGVLVTTLGRGAAVGEIALLYNVPRTATVRTRSEARLYALDRETFLVSLTGQASAAKLAQGLAEERLAELKALRDARSSESAVAG